MAYRAYGFRARVYDVGICRAYRVVGLSTMTVQGPQGRSSGKRLRESSQCLACCSSRNGVGTKTSARIKLVSRKILNPKLRKP